MPIEVREPRNTIAKGARMIMHKSWLVTADRHRATLYSCGGTERGSLHIEPVRTIENEFDGMHEHHRPDLLGRGPTANAAQHHSSHGHDDEEMLRRFAKQVAEWVAKEHGDAGKSGRYCVFAAPRMLGLLRNEFSRILDDHAELVEGELTQLRPNELAEHPAVKKAMLSGVGDAPR
jgi:protein required for attachment to host cells